VKLAQAAGNRAIVLKSGLRHFCAGADVGLFSARIDNAGRSDAKFGGVDFLRLLELLPIPIVASGMGCAWAAAWSWRWRATTSSPPPRPSSARSRRRWACIR
jgi:enoyl-CoA hydratase/carnithine racemase